VVLHPRTGTKAGADFHAFFDRHLSLAKSIALRSENSLSANHSAWLSSLPACAGFNLQGPIEPRRHNRIDGRHRRWSGGARSVSPNSPCIS
jgi:hypothetical protein